MSKIIGAWTTKAALVSFLVCLGSSSAFADLSYDISGSTTESQFYKYGSAAGTSVEGLQFTSSSFGPRNSLINLGSFQLNAPFLPLTSYDPYDFTLTIAFTAPANAGPQEFSANVTGKAALGLGIATIEFDKSSQHISFTNSQGSGSFDLAITDELVVDANLFGPGAKATIYGYISNATFATTPEPAAIVLTSALFGGLLLLFRKKLTNC